MFHNSKLIRNLDFDIKTSSKLLIIENIVFGRLASGELNADCFFSDHWRIKRDEKLIFAENFLFEDKKTMYRKTNLGNYRSLLNIMYLSKDSKNFLNKMRNIISSESIFGEASHWNDFISLRALAENPIELKKTIEEILILFVTKIKNSTNIKYLKVRHKMYLTPREKDKLLISLAEWLQGVV